MLGWYNWLSFGFIDFKINRRAKNFMLIIRGFDFKWQKVVFKLLSGWCKEKWKNSCEIDLFKEKKGSSTTS